MKTPFATLLVIVCAIAAGAVSAQEFPSKPIRILVSAPPGTAPDLVARHVGHKMAESIGKPVIVDNRPGGGGMPAINALTAAAADGHTLLHTDTGVYSILPMVNPGVEPLKGLVPIAPGGTTPQYLGVSATIKANDLQELLAAARAKPGLAYGSAGVGTAAHLYMGLVVALAKLDMIHVPFKGNAAAVQALVAGDVVAVFSGVNLLVPQAKAGKLRIVGVAAERRSRISDVPTIVEAGLPGYDVKALTSAYFAPVGTPVEIIDRLRAELMNAMRAEEVIQRLHAIDVEPPAVFTAEQVLENVRAERALYGRLIKAAGGVAQ